MPEEAPVMRAVPEWLCVVMSKLRIQ